MRGSKAILAILAIFPLAACGGGGGAASNTPPTVTRTLADTTFDAKGSAFLTTNLVANTSGVQTTTAPTTGTYNFAGTSQISSADRSLLVYGNTNMAIDFSSGIVAGEMYDLKSASTTYSGEFEYEGQVSDTGALSGLWSGTVTQQGFLPVTWALFANTTGQLRGADASSADYLADGTNFGASSGTHTGTFSNAKVSNAVEVRTAATRVE